MNKPPNSPLNKRNVSRSDRFAKIGALLRSVLPNGSARSVPGLQTPHRPAPDASAASGPATLPEALRSFLGRTKPGSAGHLEAPPAPNVTGTLTGAGRVVCGTYGNHAGRRDYKLFIPGGYRGTPIPLIVMLHGCTQSADDFAAGTQMNVLAQEHTCFVVYPQQTSAANISRCWNWFNESHQHRGEGEPSLIAGITQRLMHEYAVDSRRVYAAGLSAGAAEAAILGATYPEIYAAIGVHSGLPYGAARNLPSALAAMRNGGSRVTSPAASTIAQPKRIVPAIVFHGDRDTTVHPSNGDNIICASSTRGLRVNVRHDSVSGGRSYTCTEHVDANGTPVFEQWVIHGAGHAWSGGSSAGSYTDPLGPDAAREMMRFFLDHVHPESAPANV